MIVRVVPQVRLLLTYQWMRPGKKLQFMGFELGSDEEWSHDGQLTWASGAVEDAAGKARSTAGIQATLAQQAPGIDCQQQWSRARAGLLHFVKVSLRLRHRDILPPTHQSTPPRSLIRRLSS